MAVNTCVVTPVGSGRIYKSDDGKLKWMYVDVALDINVTYDTSLRCSLINFKNLYRMGLSATAGEVGKEVKIKQVVFHHKFAYTGTPTGQVKGVWLGLKNFQFSLAIVGNNGNTATTGPKDEVELGAVSSGSPAGHARATVYF